MDKSVEADSFSAPTEFMLSFESNRVETPYDYFSAFQSWDPDTIVL